MSENIRDAASKVDLVLGAKLFVCVELERSSLIPIEFTALDNERVYGGKNEQEESANLLAAVYN